MQDAMVAADLSPLLARAFHTDAASRATAALAEIREQRGGRAARARAYEVVAPEGADRAWFEASLLRPLVYFCESGRAPLPAFGHAPEPAPRYTLPADGLAALRLERP